MSNAQPTENKIELDDRVTDGDEITGHVKKVTAKRALISYWGSGLSEGILVETWLYLSSLKVVRKASTY